MKINGSTNLFPEGLPSAAKPQKQDGDFGKMLMDVLKEVNDAQANAGSKIEALQAGQPGVETHDVIIAAEKASIAMQLTLQVRNKVLEGYQEINRLPI